MIFEEAKTQRVALRGVAVEEATPHPPCPLRGSTRINNNIGHKVVSAEQEDDASRGASLPDRRVVTDVAIYESQSICRQYH